jgi:GMP synthase (glutamine-hydrolysing)
MAQGHPWSSLALHSGGYNKCDGGVNAFSLSGRSETRYRVRMTKRAYAIRHVAFEDLGSLEAALIEANYRIRYFEAGVDDLAPIDSDRPDLLVALGGPIGAYEEESYPFLLAELDILRRRLERDEPTLGLCLGAQLMARALGASVFPGPAKEIGWAPILLTEAGAAGSLRHLTDGDSMVLHWHGDTFNLPNNAVHLASSAAYANQAFAWGRNSLALQFHPEVGARGLERWFVGHAVEISQATGVSVPELRRRTAEWMPSLERRSRKLWREWLGSVERQ